MSIEKRIKKVIEKRLISPAKLQYRKTGDIEIVKIKDAEGKIKEKERPIKEQVLIPAKYEEVEKEVTVYVINDGIDEHEFMSKKEARQFNGN